MLQRRRFLVAPLIALGLLFMNLGAFTNSVKAHNWDSFHWDKSGPYIYVYQSWYGGCCYNQAAAARNDAWNKISILYNYWTSVHTDISVWDAWYSDSWGGLASIESTDWDWGTWWWTHITHAHSRYNNRYGSSDTWWIQGVFCQEVFHGYGFDHHPVIVNGQGSCMGLGYYAGASNVLNAHDNSDFYNRYRFH